ncbi:unnamed protein product [Absidia cylindrospora]
MNGFDQPLSTSMSSVPSQQQTQQQGQQRQQQTGDPEVENARLAYRDSLAGLTFNSKPIITGLTIKAQDNQFAAMFIVQEIERQIRTNTPGQKLPVLYLIDSICKNVGGPYITYFARNIVSLFMDTYTLVDLPTRKSFERLLQTWKTGMPNGNPVFARHLTEAIERAVNFIQQSQSHSPHQLPQQANASPVVPMNIKSRDPRNRAKMNPNGPQITTPSPPPNNGRGTPPNTSTDPLKQLLNQLTPSNPIQPGPSYKYQQQSLPPSSPAVAAALSSGQNHSQRLSNPPMTPPPVPSASVTPAPIATLVNTSDLLQNLLSHGILHTSHTNSVSTVATSSATPMTGSTPTPPLANAVLPSVVSSPSPLSTDTPRLDSKDLQRERRGAVEALYTRLPLKCKQCGIRYPDTKEGKEKMDGHLDSHFRQNRRMKERAKRGLSRSWFVSENDWIHGAEGELTSHQMPTFMTDKQQRRYGDDDGTSLQQNMDDSRNPGDMNSMDNNPSSIQEKKERLNRAHKQLEDTMVVMPHDDGERKPCPICGESFTDVWNDDEEEWMYKNAIFVDSKIYHATCHADAVKSRTSAQNMDVDEGKVDYDMGQKRKVIL